MDGRVHIQGQNPHVEAIAAGTREIARAVDPRLVQSRVTPADQPTGTSYETRENTEERRLRTFEAGLGRLSETVAEAAAREGRWCDRVRAGLVALLGFLEDEPDWTHLLFETLPNGRRALARERGAMGVLTALLDDGGPQAIGEIALDPELTAELVAGGVFAVVRCARARTHGSDEAERSWSWRPR